MQTDWGIKVLARLPDIDWDRVTRKLRSRLKKMSWLDADIFDGVSLEDVVQEAVRDFLEDSTWDPTKSSAETFLWVIARRRLLKHIKRHTRCSDSLDDPQLLGRYRAAAEVPLADSCIASELANEARHAADLIRESARGDPDLERIVDAIERSDETHNSNQQAASVAGISVAEFLNRKRRLARKLRFRRPAQEAEV